MIAIKWDVMVYIIAVIVGEMTVAVPTVGHVMLVKIVYLTMKNRRLDK